jgi:hypothetical protein
MRNERGDVRKIDLGATQMGATTYVYTISYVAKMLGEPKAWLEELALMNLEPEDGCLGVIGHMDAKGDELVAVTAFTTAGIEALKELVADIQRN